VPDILILSLHSMMARRSARECYPESQRIPVFNPAISEMRKKLANIAIHLIRHRSYSLPVGARWMHLLRPGDGQRWLVILKT
jgi:hypothetical protein